MTFSIVACDRQASPSPEWGVAVASKFLAVGALVPAAEAGVGAIATQALANATFTTRGLQALASGDDAHAVLRALTEADSDKEQRQVGIVDARGEAATFTGEECIDWAGGRTGDGYCCQGNVLAGAAVVDRMAEAFEGSGGELADRLMQALAAGFAAGGDARGMQSAALLVVREGAGYLGATDRAIDLRVDDHPDAVSELDRVLRVHHFYFPRPESLEFVDIDEPLAEELRTLLARAGYDSGRGEGYDSQLRNTLFDFVGMENLEQRWSDESRIERGVLEALRKST